MGKVLFLTNNDNTFILYNWLLEQGEQVILCSDRIHEDMLAETGADIIVSYNYRYRISQEVLDYAKGEVFNLHISMLPWNRGSNPNYWSFMENTPKGVTIHKVDRGLDTGDIVAQKELMFDERTESFATTYQKLHEEIIALFMENWENIKQKKYTISKQGQGGSYHSIKDFNQFTDGHQPDWQETIAEYKERLERRSKACTFPMADNQ